MGRSARSKACGGGVIFLTFSGHDLRQQHLKKHRGIHGQKMFFTKKMRCPDFCVCNIKPWQWNKKHLNNHMIWELGEGKTKAGVHFPVAQEVKASFNILGFEIECVFWGASSCIVTWVFEGSYPSNLEGVLLAVVQWGESPRAAMGGRFGLDFFLVKLVGLKPQRCFLCWDKGSSVS